jgi:hypothetical protein
MRWLIAITLILSIFLMAGCGSMNNSRDTRVIDFRTGSRALDMQIVHGASQKIYEDEELSVLLELHNRGTGDITNGLLFVKGYDPRYLPNLHIEPSPVLNLEGKDDFDPTGELSFTYEIVDRSVKAPRHKEILPQTLQVVACYPYSSHGSYPVCIDPDPHNRRIDNKICYGTEVSPGAQGHPVAVTAIEEKVNRNDIRFNLRISNVGDGIVYNRRVSPEACAFDLQRTDLDMVHIRKVEFSGKTLRCEPSNPVRLINGGALVSCVCENCLNLDQGAYRTVLNVEMEYGYRNDIQTQVEILKE